jgi:beta-glucosidase
MSFRKDFAWGVATAAYQIEGAAFEDGKGLSIWDEFCRQPARILNSDTGNIACDHYHRYEEDVKIMAQLGIKAYRFSISWPRILPDGIGRVNQKGIDFYNKLVDCLLEHDITPFVTLYHWDLPEELYKKGGWLNSESADWFEEYTTVVVKAFGDRVKNIITFNEPQVFIGCAFCKIENAHAPGIKLPLKDTIRMSHNIMKAHGQAVIAMRKIYDDLKIGYAPTGTPHSPASNSEKDMEIAKKCYFSVSTDENWFWNVAWWSDPVMLGCYPKEPLKEFVQYLPKGWEEDLKIIHQPLDFYGQNIYGGVVVKATQDGKYEVVTQGIGPSKTAFNWSITPESLYWGTKFLYERYKTPIYITENGMACHDTVSLDGKVHDPNRIDFLNRYLLSLRKSSEDGTDIRGYFQWSLMDNFEWAQGYNERFGIVFVDFNNQKRILKDSAYWYTEVIKQNGDNL